MRSESDCGPAALAAVTGCAYERILETWPGGWMGGDRGILSLPNDTPLDHFALLVSMGIPIRIITLADILAGRFAGDKTMVLLHRPGAFIEATLAQHWGVIQRADHDGVHIHWGNGNIKTLDKEAMTRAYADGWPACAYVIGEGKVGISWWVRLLAFLTGRFI